MTTGAVGKGGIVVWLRAVVYFLVGGCSRTVVALPSCYFNWTMGPFRGSVSRP